MRGCCGWSRTCVGGALLDDPAVVEEDDQVGDLAGEADLVGDDDQRRAGPGEVLDDGEHLADQFRVERRRRFVEQDDAGLERERPGDRDPLLLAAGELARVGVRLVGEPDPVEQRPSVLPAPRPRRFRPVATGAATTLSSTVRCGNRLKFWNTNPIRLRWARIARSLQFLEPVAVAADADQFAVDADVADVELLQVVDGAQQRRLARAGRAEDRP